MVHRIVAGLVVTVVVFAGSHADAAKPGKVLKARFAFDFTDATLQDAMEYLSQLTKVPIKLDSKVDGDLEITGKGSKNSTFGQSLKKLLRPHKLTFRVDKADTKITIVPRKRKK